MDSLEREAEMARAAIDLKFQEIKTSLQNAADPREWAREHPWIAVGAAAAAGFAAALAVAAPRRASRRRPRRRRAARERFAGDDRDARQPSSGIGGSIAAMLFELAKIFMTTHLGPMMQTWWQGFAAHAAQAAAGPPPTDMATQSGDSDARAANGGAAPGDSMASHDGRAANDGSAGPDPTGASGTPGEPTGPDL